MSRRANIFRISQGIVFLSFLILFSSFSGCASKSRMIPIPDESLPLTETRISSTGYNHFINASLLELFEAFDEALIEYEKALRYFPESAVIRTDYSRLLFRKKLTEKALEQALMIQPKTAEVHLLIGDCLRLSDKLEQSMTYYRQTVALDPDNINAYWYLAGYYRSVDQTDSAISAYYELSRLSDTYRIWHELGTLLGKDRRYSEAAIAFKNAIELNSGKSNINAFLALGTTYDALDSLDRMETTLDQAKELDPYDVRIFRQRLAAYLSRNDLKNSIEASRDLIALVPSDWVAQRRLGILLFNDGQLDAADSLFKSRIEMGDDNILSSFYLARIAIGRETYSEAIPLLDDVIETEPSFCDGWLSLGFVYRQLDSLEKAISTYKIGMGHSVNREDTGRFLFSLGTAYEGNDQFEKTVDTFEQLLAMYPDHAAANNYLGYLLADRGLRLRYAMQLIEKALEMSPDNGAYLDSFAWVHFKLGNYDLALTNLKKAVDLLDDDAVIYEHLGDVYKAMGDTDEATRQYKRALNIDPDSIIIKEKMKE